MFPEIQIEVVAIPLPRPWMEKCEAWYQWEDWFTGLGMSRTPVSWIRCRAAAKWLRDDVKVCGIHARAKSIVTAKP